MEIQTERGGDVTPTSKATIFVGGQSFEVTEDDGNLVVRKTMSATTDGSIRIKPCVSNQIEIS